MSAIGDTCHALAVARNLADNWPGCRITWIIGRTESLLLGNVPDVEFIIFEKSEDGTAYAGIRRAMRDRGFDVALCMHASKRANRLIRHLPARLKVGCDFRRAREFQWLFTNRRVPAANTAAASC